jgi:hypothetical protein
MVDTTARFIADFSFLGERKSALLPPLTASTTHIGAEGSPSRPDEPLVAGWDCAGSARHHARSPAAERRGG